VTVRVNVAAPAIVGLVMPARRLQLSSTRDIWCIVDADDYEWITEHNWNYGWHRNTRWKFYAKRNVGRERSTLYLHREILLRAEPPPFEGMVAHHVNGQSLDDRKANLGWLTDAQNKSAQFRDRRLIPSIESLWAQAIVADDGGTDIPF